MATLAEKVFDGVPDAVREAETALLESSHTEDPEKLRRALVHHYSRPAGKRRDGGVNHLERSFEDALRHMRPIYEAAPDDQGNAFRFFSLLVDTGRFTEALDFLEPRFDRIEGAPFGFEINVIGSLARIHYIRGEFDRAERYLTHMIARARETFGDDLEGERGRLLASAMSRLARLYVNTGRAEEAVRLVGDFPQSVEHQFLRQTANRARLLLSEGSPSGHPDARPVDLDRLTVACVKHGKKYGPDYVNRLYSMVRRHLPGDWRFVCYTDDPAGLRPEVGVVDISAAKISGWWTKLALFDPRFPLEHDTVFYLDLDTVVTGDLSFIAGLKVGFHIFEHPDSPCFNSSVMLFDRKFAAPIYRKIRREDLQRLVGDQDWIEECMPALDTFERGLIQIYRGVEPGTDAATLATTDVRIVTFPTNPKPHQIETGWVAEHWR